MIGAWEEKKSYNEFPSSLLARAQAGWGYNQATPFPILTVANLAPPGFFLALRARMCQWELVAVNPRRLPHPLEVLNLAQASVYRAFFKLSSVTPLE